MTIVFAVINFTLVILGILGFFLTIIGIPVGMVLLILYLLKEESKRNRKFFNLILISFSGLPLLVVTFTLWALIQFITVMFGYPLLSGDIFK